MDFIDKKREVWSIAEEILLIPPLEKGKEIKGEFKRGLRPLFLYFPLSLQGEGD